MPKFKAGVMHYSMAHELTKQYSTIDEIHKRLVGRDAIITSAREGMHKRSSLHYQGKVIDLRTSDMGPGTPEEVVRELKNALGFQFDVILESDHIHVEYDP
ncbi:MAG: hypothetical protein WAO55_02230 [Candidatus Manganitrophaceae bacterium]